MNQVRAARLGSRRVSKNPARYRGVEHSSCRLARVPENRSRLASTTGHPSPGLRTDVREKRIAAAARRRSSPNSTVRAFQSSHSPDLRWRTALAKMGDSRRRVKSPAPISLVP
jgi:hypothetical protein